MATNIEAFVARAYLMARRLIPRDVVFKIWGGCKFEYVDSTGQYKGLSKTTTPYKSNEIQEFFDELVNSLRMKYATILLQTLVFEFNFPILPPGGCSGTTDRSLESVFMKKSVIQVVNDDNNCFWYAMAILMNPKNEQVKDNTWPKTRMTLGGDFFSKSRCDWDTKVSFLQLPLVEEQCNCNIYIIDVNNIPMLGSSISLLMNCLMYKSLNRGKEQYYLLYDDEKQHYDCISDIKIFFGVR